MDHQEVLGDSLQQIALKMGSRPAFQRDCRQSLDAVDAD